MSGGGYLNSPSEPVGSITNDEESSDNGMYVDLFDEDDVIDSYEYQDILDYLTNSANASFENVKALASSNKNSFSKYYDGTNSPYINDNDEYDFIKIFIGNFEWEPVYLSLDKSGNVILTLVFDSIFQKWGFSRFHGGDYWEVDERVDEDELTSSSVISSFSAGWSSSNYELYPDNMYGTSYINAVTLNNGGVYATSDNALVTATKNSDNPFAKFTMSEYGLTKYLVTPRDISWQENQSSKIILGSDYRYSNESWSADIADSEFSSSIYNYSSKQYNDAWADSYVWLPSYSELTLWNSGYAHDIWLRSGVDGKCKTIGHGDCSSRSMYHVWPAIHLNLSAINEEIYPGSVSVGEIYNSSTNKFDEDNYFILLKYLTGDENADLTTVTELAEKNNNQFSSNGYIGTDASAFRETVLTSGIEGSTSYVTKSECTDICVRLGGLNWQVMYLSKDKNDNTILTLWLDSNVQDIWVDREQDEGTCHGYLDGGLYSVFTFDSRLGANNPSNDYPSNMYGASYVNAVTLNNGGVYNYHYSYSSVFTATQSTSSAFALFTMPEFGLTDYLVKPRNVSWQEEQSAKTILSSSSRYPNEAYATGLSDSDFWYDSEHSAYINYSNKAYNDAWADSYLWLPSRSETGYSHYESGLWGASESQRVMFGVDDTDVAIVGGKSVSATGRTLLRSGSGNLDAAYIQSIGLFANWESGTRDGYAIRPALHLNLSEIYASFGFDADNIVDGEINITPQKDTYNGSVKTPTIVVTYNGETLVKDTDYKLTYSLNGTIVSELKDMGVYTITATGKRNYKGELSTTYIIEGGTISTTTISPPNDCVVFRRSSGMPKIYLQDGTTRLIKDTDYTITHDIDYVALTGTATVYGIGNYGGVSIRTYTLVLLDPKAQMYMAIYN